MELTTLYTQILTHKCKNRRQFGRLTTDKKMSADRPEVEKYPREGGGGGEGVYEEQKKGCALAQTKGEAKREGEVIMGTTLSKKKTHRNKGNEPDRGETNYQMGEAIKGKDSVTLF